MLGLAAALCGLIFALDINIPLGVEISVAYIFPLLVGSRLPGVKSTIAIATLCSVLTLAGLFYSPEGSLVWQAMVNRALVLVIIFAITGFILWFKHTEEATRSSEDRYRLLVENAPLCIHGIDLAGRFTSMNPAGLAMMGVELESAVCGEPYMDSVADEDSRRIQSLLTQAYANHASSFQFKSRTKRGIESKYFDSSFIPIVNEAGEVVKIMGVSQDITERYYSEQALRESEDRFSSMADFLPQTVFETDLYGKLTYVNSMGIEKFGLTKEDLVNGVNALHLFVREDADKIRKHMKNILNGGRGNDHSYTALKPDGGTFPVLVYSSPVMKNEEAIGFRGVVLDISERLQEEERLRRAHNLESLGVLAGGIAHDFNNVLTGIIGNLAMLDMTLDKNSDAHKFVQQCVTAADRTRDLTKQLLTFAKGGAPLREVSRLDSLIHETINLSLHGSNTKPELRLAGELNSVYIDKGQISQVLQNIILNGDQAMPGGGILIVSAKNVCIEKNSALPLEPGNYVEVAITDQGIGMSQAVLEQAFVPYFSTKKSGHGLGLAITYSIIQKHGGYITIDSEPDVGTTFTFYLPASVQKAITDVKQKSAIPRGSGRILLMDDEEMIHEVLSKMLETLGYEVEDAYDGETALQKYLDAMGTGKPFDMVILDLTIPGAMGGLETMDKILEIDALAKVVISSGYANDEVMTNYADYGFVNVMQKPIALQKLAEVVKNIIPDDLPSPRA